VLPYTKFPNIILEKLAGIDLTAAEYRILCIIARRTWGWSENEAWISLSLGTSSYPGFARLTGRDRQNISRSLKTLEACRIIVVRRDHKQEPRYRINLDVNAWQVSSLRTTRKKLHGPDVPTDYRASSGGITKRSPAGLHGCSPTGRPLKETPKEPLKKEKERRSAPDSDPFKKGVSENSDRRERPLRDKAEHQKRNGIAGAMINSNLYSEEERIELSRGRTAEELEVIHRARLLAAGKNGAAPEGNGSGEGTPA
jgi:phage replication O-like protein O